MFEIFRAPKKPFWKEVFFSFFLSFFCFHKSEPRRGQLPIRVCPSLITFFFLSLNSRIMILSFVVRYLSYAFILAFFLLCLIAGLYYLAEFVEEHTRITKKVMNWLVYTVLAVHVLLLLFESDLPKLSLLFSLGCNLVYRSLLKTYPFIDIFSPIFIASGVLAFVDHFVWFYFFVYNFYEAEDIIAFFIICVWLIPFAFFVSLSAGDNVLPFAQAPSESNSEESSRKSSNILLSFLKYLGRKKESVLPTGSNTSKML